MRKPAETSPFAGLSITSLGTLASRVLGLARDMATASLLGIAGDGVMDAFVLAFRLPNLFRRLLGEGALATSYLPVFAEQLQRDRRQACRFASTMLALLTVLLAAIVLFGELGLAAAGCVWAGDGQAMQLIALSAVLLPYLLLVCLAAQLSATLQALGHFGLPALAPLLLNVVWLFGAWLAGRVIGLTHQQRAYVLAASILVAGVLQVLVQLKALAGLGFRFQYQWRSSRDAVMRVVASTGPMVLGLAATQVNTLVDSLMAWSLTAPTAGEPIGWLDGMVDYPFRPGAASAIYFAERLYQFPLGILGLAVATVIFPTLSRHAARGASHELGADLTAGLRLVLFLGLPASAGLALLAEPLAMLFFGHGDVTAAEIARLPPTIACYSCGVWAFCASAVLVRGYYAQGDQRTPLRMAWLAMLVNVLLNCLLIWPLGESGLALSTSLAATVQLAALIWAFDRSGSRLDWAALRRTCWQTAASTAGMAAVCGLLLEIVPAGPGWAAARVAVPVLGGLATVLFMAWLLGMDELHLILPRRESRRAIPAGDKLGVFSGQ